MPYVSFSRKKTKSQIEQLTNSTDGMLYFAADGNNVVAGRSVSGGGIYLGNGSTPRKIATRVIVEDSLTSNSSSNALSAKQGSVLNTSVSELVSGSISQGGISVTPPTDSNNRLVIDFTDSISDAFFMTCRDETLVINP